jgi:HSP20 family protein
MHTRHLAQIRSPFGDIERLFGSLMVPSLTATGRAWSPAVDIVRDEDGNLVYKFDMPGISGEDISITAEAGRLNIRGERKSEVSQDGYTERSYGRFERSLPLPEGAVIDEISSQLTDGVLSVTVPGAQAKSQARQIPVG